MARVMRDGAAYSNNPNVGNIFGDIIESMISNAPKHMEKEDFYAALTKMREGCKRSEKLLIESNLRMVANRVRRSWGIRPYTGVPADDRFSYGMAGLNKALERFDMSSGLMFSTYATHWIDQYIERGFYDECNMYGGIRVPTHMHQKYNRIRSIFRDKYKDEDIDFTTLDMDELVKRANEWEEDRIANSDREDLILKKWKAKEIEDVLAVFSRRQSSIVVGDDGISDSIYDFMEAPEISLFDDVTREMNVELLEKIVSNSSISERDLTIILRRYNGDTLDEIGKDLGVTRERVRQLQSQTMGQLKTALETLQFKQNIGGQTLSERQNLYTLAEAGIAEINKLGNSEAEAVESTIRFKRTKLIFGTKLNSVPSEMRPKLLQSILRHCVTLRKAGRSRYWVAHEYGFKNSATLESALKRHCKDSHLYTDTFSMPVNKGHKNPPKRKVKHKLTTTL